MRKLTCFLFAAAVLIGLASSPLHAGAVYVPIDPMASDDQVFVSVSNPTAEQVNFTYYLIGQNVSGVDDRPDELPIRFLDPGQTIVLRSQLPLGQRGLLEVYSAAHLPVTARLGKVDDTFESIMGPSVPVITSDNAAQGGENLYLQGLQREVNGTISSNVRLVNLSKASEDCNVTLQNSTGGVLGGFINLPARPSLSVSAFDDGLVAVLGNADAGNVRARFSCTGPFYVYSVSHQPHTEQSVFIDAAANTDSAFQPPGLEVPCPAGAFCFRTDGVFHVPVNGNKVKRLEFPTPPGDYNRLHVNLNVKLANWQTPSSGLHNIFWLALDRNRNLIGYVNLKGPNANTVLFRHGFGQPQEDKAKVTVPAIFVPGQTYNFDYVFDTNIGAIDLIIRDASGQIVAQIFHSPDTNKIRVTNNEIVLMDFGFLGINPNEPPTFGWEYSNLTMTIQP